MPHALTTISNVWYIHLSFMNLCLTFDLIITSLNKIYNIPTNLFYKCRRLYVVQYQKIIYQFFILGPQIASKWLLFVKYLYSHHIHVYFNKNILCVQIEFLYNLNNIYIPNTISIFIWYDSISYYSIYFINSFSGVLNWIYSVTA